MSKLTPEQFEAYLKKIRALAEGPFEEMQKEEWKSPTISPMKFYQLAKARDLLSLFPAREIWRFRPQRAGNSEGTRGVQPWSRRYADASALCHGFELENLRPIWQRGIERQIYGQIPG